MSGNRSSRLITLLTALAVFVVVLFVWMQRYALFDWWRLRGYTPPAAVASLADETTMTEKARKLFYAFHPRLEDKTAFNQNCPAHDHSITLGCYVTNRGIYLYDIQDDRLEGVEQVTAAHEMLHVGYQRLGPKERERVNRLLREAYDQIDNQRIKDVISTYKNSGADIDNELHSILGTEVAQLPPELETYYKRYFTDRAKVVAMAVHYSDEFTRREREVEDYDAKLGGLRIQIETNEAVLDQQSVSLQADRKLLDQQYAAGNYSAYNASVPAYNVAVADYNALLRATQSKIAEYNAMVEARNKIAIEHQELMASWDSNAKTETQQTR